MLILNLKLTPFAESGMNFVNMIAQVRACTLAYANATC